MEVWAFEARRVWKFSKGMAEKQSDRGSLFQIRGIDTLRRIVKTAEWVHVTTSMRSNSFVTRMVNGWNKLTEEVVEFGSLREFIKRQNNVWPVVFGGDSMWIVRRRGWSRIKYPNCFPLVGTVEGFHPSVVKASLVRRSSRCKNREDHAFRRMVLWSNSNENWNWTEVNQAARSLRSANANLAQVLV